MQNIETLRNLGFQQNSRGMWFWRGKNQKFVGKLGYNSKFISLYLVSPDIDKRPVSANKGYHFLSYIKDCVSNGSVEQVLKTYDIEESRLNRGAFGIKIKQ